MKPVLEVHDVAYAVGKRRLLHPIRLSVAPGRLIAVVGPNGAGKTTFLRILAGLLRGEGGLFIDDLRVERMSRKARARCIAFVPADDTPIDELTVWDVVAEGRYAHRRSALDHSEEHDRAVRAALDAAGLEAFADRPMSQLSTGERRRVWIALGLAQAAPILLLDEPTAHLDLRFAQETLRLMRKITRDGRSVVAVLHDLNEAAQVADEVALIDNGRLVRLGSPQDVFTRETLARCYGVDVEIVSAGDSSIRIFTRA